MPRRSRTACKIAGLPELKNCRSATSTTALSLVRSLDANSRTFFAIASSSETDSRARFAFLAPLLDFTRVSIGFDDCGFRLADEEPSDFGIRGRLLSGSKNPCAC
jgi:hypothetical protein